MRKYKTSWKIIELSPIIWTHEDTINELSKILMNEKFVIKDIEDNKE